MLPGAGNHYKYITRDETGEQAPFMPSLYVDGDRLLDPERELPDDFYSTVNYTDKAIQFIDEKPKDEPFLICHLYCTTLAISSTSGKNSQV